MKTGYERIQADEGSSFRLLYQKVKAEDFAWDYHYHPEIEIVCVYGGNGRRHVGNHLSYYQEGDLVLIGSNVPHGGFGFGAIGEHEEVVIQFMPDFLGEGFLHKPEMKNIKKLLERGLQGIKFEGATKQIVSEELRKINEVPPFQRMVYLLNLLEFLANSKEFELLNKRETRYDFGMRDQLRLRKIYQFVEENFTTEIEIQKVAELANLTVPAFCNYFKKNLNQTFTDFVNEYRVNYACKLLNEGRTVADACFESGFNNVSYFGRVFKKLKQVQPSQFILQKNSI